MTHAPLTAVQHQIESAAICVAELLHIGCRVLSVRCSATHEAARVHIEDPGALLDHIDPISVDTSSVVYYELGCRYRECEVFWLLRRPQAEVALERIRERFA